MEKDLISVIDNTINAFEQQRPSCSNKTHFIALHKDYENSFIYPMHRDYQIVFDYNIEKGKIVISPYPITEQL